MRYIVRTSFPNASPPARRSNDARGVGQRANVLDHGPERGALDEGEEVDELVVGAHRGTSDRELQEEHPVEVGGRVRAAGGSAHDHPPPGRSARRECDQVASPTVSMTRSHLAGRRGTGLQGLIGPQLDRSAALLGVTGRAEHRVPLRLGQQDRGAGHPATGALHEHGGGAGESDRGRASGGR